MNATKTIFLAAVLALGLAAQPTLCGTKPSHQHANYLAVGCVDYTLLAKYFPDHFPEDLWGVETQVIVHGKFDSVVQITMDEGLPTETVKYERLIWDKNYGGRWIALVPFKGEFTTIKMVFFTPAQ